MSSDKVEIRWGWITTKDTQMPISDRPPDPNFSEVRKASERHEKLNDVGESTAKAVEERRRIKEELDKATEAARRRMEGNSKQN
jgi:hypothetical protein